MSLTARGVAITSNSPANTLPDRSAGSTIQGYIYQFDHTILQILSAGSSRIVVEGLEDVDVHDDDDGSTAVQVKYLEAGHYATPATLRSPVLLMLDAFAKGADYNFILHVHFGDGSIPPTSFTPAELRTCLTEHKRKPTPHVVLHYEKYSDEVLDAFAARMTIRSGLSRDDQLKEVLQKLAEALECQPDDVNELHYANALKYVQDLAIGRSESDRTITRDNFLLEINKRKTLYTRWHREVIGQERYVSQLAKRIKFSNSLRPNRHKALQLVIPPDGSHIGNIADIIEHLATKSYGIGKLPTTKVWTAIIDGSAEHIKKLKLELLSRDICFEDGFDELEFQLEVFVRQPVTNIRGSMITKTSYDVRIIKFINLQSFVDGGNKFDIVMLTSEVNADSLKNASKVEPVEVFGLGQEHIKKILQEVSR